MKQVFINGRFLTQRMTGVVRFADEIVKHLDEILLKQQGQGVETKVTLIAPRGDLRDLDLKVIGLKQLGVLSGHPWEQFELPFLAKGDLLVNLTNPAPVLYPKQIVTIHDTATFTAPSGFSKAFRAWYRVMIPALYKGASRVITVSEFSRDELNRNFGDRRNSVDIIHNAVDHLDVVKSDPNALKKFGLEGRKFVLCGVGTAGPNKNYGAFFRIAALLQDEDCEFVIAGTPGCRVHAKAEINIDGPARFLGRTTDAELKALYESAVCFVFPSRYEGFGIPPVEAMHCGCPVVASDAASIPEICGPAVIYADPEAPYMFACHIRRLLYDSELRSVMSEGGRQRAHAFSWEASALQLYSIIGDCLTRAAA